MAKAEGAVWITTGDQGQVRVQRRGLVPVARGNISDGGAEGQSS